MRILREQTTLTGKNYDSTFACHLGRVRPQGYQTTCIQPSACTGTLQLCSRFQEVTRSGDSLFDGLHDDIIFSHGLIDTGCEVRLTDVCLRDQHSQQVPLES